MCIRLIVAMTIGILFFHIATLVRDIARRHSIRNAHRKLWKRADDVA